MSEVEVHIAPLLHSYTGGQRRVAAKGTTLGDVLDDLDRRFPGIRFRVVDEQGHARPHVRFFVNGEDTRSLAMELKTGDEIHVIGALSGG